MGKSEFNFRIMVKKGCRLKRKPETKAEAAVYRKDKSRRSMK